MENGVWGGGTGIELDRKTDKREIKDQRKPKMTQI